MAIQGKTLKKGGLRDKRSFEQGRKRGFEGAIKAAGTAQPATDSSTSRPQTHGKGGEKSKQAERGEVEDSQGARQLQAADL